MLTVEHVGLRVFVPSPIPVVVRLRARAEHQGEPNVSSFLRQTPGAEWGGLSSLWGPRLIFSSSHPNFCSMSWHEFQPRFYAKSLPTSSGRGTLMTVAPSIGIAPGSRLSISSSINCPHAACLQGALRELASHLSSPPHRWRLRPSFYVACFKGPGEEAALGFQLRRCKWNLQILFTCPVAAPG